ncbi:Bypass of stop codon protein 6 [Ceratocystis fimbriata CBS 114723]|uniref:Bypass of stop codon protein 6 n=1 Tax=Ceratocystis fimbriata CBS 114723 TaxID=1035309 RepID=A0A2C5XHR2_9PEZI|nr:Bypass of stop codon protein 6 [Ceratocystis fimbriata CBS 114723]
MSVSDVNIAPRVQLSSPSQDTDIFDEKSKDHIDLEAPAATVASGEDSDQLDLQHWNAPRINIFRTGSVIFSFFLAGMSDGSIGALLPYIEQHYNISYMVVSVLFLSPCLGYLLAGLVNNSVHYYMGQFGIAFLGPLLHAIGFLIIIFHPPYPVLPVAVFLVGLGSGLLDSAWNAWVGNMYYSNELLGIIHAAYGLGGTIGPLIATAMVAKAHLQWWYYFYIMLAFSIAEVVVSSWAFWGQNGLIHRASLQAFNDGRRTTTREILRQPYTWLLSIFLLGYVGVEISLGGWVTTFMIEVRHAEPFLAGITTTLYWLGITLGRLILGFVTSRIGEKLAITVYLSLCISLEVMYWLVPSIPASIAFVILMGFFLGPLFPAAVVATTKLLTKDYHVGTIGIASAAGGCGGALLPFAVGALAQSHGVAVLQVTVLVILVLITCIWVCIPGGFHKGGLEEARDNELVPGRELVKLYRWAEGKICRKKESELVIAR